MGKTQIMYSKFRRSKWLQILIPLAAASLILTLFSTLLRQPTAPLPLSTPPANTTIAAVVTPNYVSLNGLLGNYYPNQNLTGEPKSIQVDTNFDQLWENNQPTLTQLSPPFSVRWQGYIKPKFSERYRIITTSDDGIRLWIDDQILIDNWSVHAATTDQAEIELQADDLHKITIEFFDRGYSGVLKLEWLSPQQPREVVPSSALFAPAAEVLDLTNGLSANYYASHDLTGSPTHNRISSMLDQRWNDGQPLMADLNAPLSVRWQGYIKPEFSDEYQLITTSDDGVRLWIDDHLLIDNWSVQSATENRRGVELVADQIYPITIEFFDRGYDGIMKLEWESANQEREVIPTSQLFYKAALQERVDSGQAIRPRAIPITSPEIVNPLRGLYRWMGSELVPSPNPLPRPSFDSYERYEWRSLEPKLNQYDFTVIENDLQRAAREGRKHAFRVRVLVSGEAISVPDYMRPLMERGWSNTFDGDSTSTYIPDWNDPDFLQRVERLIKALGERYDKDPRVGYIDIGIFGIWGEWHTHQLDYPSATGAQTMTKANRQKLIDFHIAAFPNKRLLMMSDDEQSLLYALKQSPRIGWRRDSLGDDHFDKPSKDANLWAIARDRWKTAPVVTELINPRGHSDPESYALARDQVMRYHVSMISNGNAIKWSALSAQGRQMLIEAAKQSGYRYRPQDIYFPSTLKPAATFTIASTWLNEGVAPAYEPWAIVWQLRSSSGAIAWQEESSLDLQLLLPTTSSSNTAGTPANERLSAFKHEDQITLPTNLAPGTYQLHLLVRDPQGYRAPMSLAIQGQQSDGSYAFKTITITT